ncbi:MAG: tetratricopeptide repeat protein [Acidobacteria bacterium]|nr:tetratricopeptide repeat protein [Acidobacteriota bacterium]
MEPATPAPPQSPSPRQVATPAPSTVVTRPSIAGAGENDYFRLALYYQQSGDFENALVQYKKVLERNEMNAEAHNNLGVLYQNKGLSDEAVREFKRAVSIDPKYSKGHNNLGVALLRSGQVDAAASEFRWLLDADPKNVDALINLGLALKAGNRAIEAREYLLRALLVKNTHPAVHYNLALLYEEDDELVKAIEHYEKFLQFAGAEHAAITKDVRSKVGNLRARLVDNRGK